MQYSSSTSPFSTSRSHTSQSMQHHSPVPLTPTENLLSRLQLSLEIIEKEYTEFNAKNAARKQKKIIPRLFYSFYTSSLCTDYIVACYEYLECFLLAPIQEGEELNLSGAESERKKPSAKVLTLQQHLQRVAESWSAILLYRAEMNRHETITVSNTMKRSEHFLNDTFDHFFFEALYLLVEYCIEFRFMDQSRAASMEQGGGNKVHSNAGAQPAGTPAVNTGGPSVIPSPTNASTTATSVSSTVAKSKASTASATAIAAAIERNWRLVQHELQRIMRSRNFNYSQKQHARHKHHPTNINKGNGLNHAPLGNVINVAGGASGSGQPRSHHKHGKNSLSYRDPSTFRLHGPRKWNEDPVDADDADDTRALSHLPGHFKTKGSFGILECLDLRSPVIASILPNPRTMATANDKYVFGSEERRLGAKKRFHGRLTHAEEKYLTEQHAKQEKREAEVKARMEREAREEHEREEAEERRREEEELRLTRSMESDEDGQALRLDVQSANIEESKEQMTELDSPLTLTLPVPSLKLPSSSSSSNPTQQPSSLSALNSHHNSNSTLRPVPPHHSSGAQQQGVDQPTRPTSASSNPLFSSRSARTQARNNGAASNSLHSSHTARRSNVSIRLAALHPALAVQVAALQASPPISGRRPTLDEKLQQDTSFIRVDRNSNRITLKDIRL